MRRKFTPLITVSVATVASLVGGAAQAAVAGPDTFGYRLVDQADGAVYNYIDITATGTLVGSGDEVLAPSFALAAPFEFYGVVVNNVRVSTNGFITSTAGTSADFSNDCPLPLAPGGGGFRIAPLHDDFVTSIYYQYFDEAGAAALGYPGETAGISVFQWDGQHFSGPADDFVDFEAILFHDDFSILTMVAVDVENGLSSTLGIQNESATVALNYVCNVGGSVIPGTTAVLYTLGPAPDSNCCNSSPSGVAGCTNGACQTAICADDPFCCDSNWDAICAGDAATTCAILCGTPPAVSINEIRIDQTGTDNDEYFELVGPPGTPLTDIQYVVLGDAPTGVVESVINLSGQVIPPSGRLVVARPTFTLGTADLTTTAINFENTDTVTHMLLGGFTGAVNNNLDPNGDGTLDSTPWLVMLDDLAVVHPASTELPYGPPNVCTAGPLCQAITDPVSGAAPFQVFRCADGLGSWYVGQQDVLALPATDTPGGPNPCACGDGVLVDGEDCDDAGETATCDVDCTVVACGDAVFNATAGEECDDGGESATCDTDCTVAVCGDMLVNGMAGETCDDGGRTGMCDADCTAVTCGDGVTNATAGEECDGDGMGAGGETAACDVDCTAAMCGDMVLNVTALEECDDGGETDMCDADCTAVSCGDGTVNAAASEECDDSGESATCDVDCTAVSCGDGVTNATAGEECDDSGESSECDDDCTAATCGDGTVNATAGEECDDGNTDDGDGCAADCTEESAGSTGGSDTGASDTGASDTGDTGADTTAGSTGGESGVDDTGPGPVTLSAGDSTDGGDTDTDTETGASVPGDDGCSCSTDRDAGGRRSLWSMLSLLGLGALRRRRRG